VRALVVGGGILGLFAALHLAREGADVAVLERGEPGEWSRAAAGILEFTRFSINRISARGYPASYLRMALRGDARIRAGALGARWVLSYLRAWGREPPSGMWEAVRWLGEYSRSEYRAMAEASNDFEYAEEPLHEVGGDVGAALEEARRDPLSPRVEAGECCGMESLVYLDAARLSTGAFISRILGELRGLGARIVRAAALGVRPASGEVLLEGGRTEGADAVVVAAGYRTRALGVPVAPFKGYGFLTGARARAMFVDLRSGIAVVPLRGRSKLTGRFDLDAGGDHSPALRVLRRGREALGDFAVHEMAVGYRPCTPDGFPVVDRVGSVVVATGACRLGWTYAPALGRLAADLALGRGSPGALGAGRFGPPRGVPESVPI
jgi:D-proline dehydrogenase